MARKTPTGEKTRGKTAMLRLGPVFGSRETNRSQTNTPRAPVRPPGSHLTSDKQSVRQLGEIPGYWRIVVPEKTHIEFGLLHN